MGSGASTNGKTDYQVVASAIENTLANQKALLGKRIHVVGLVGHAGTVLHSPFAEAEGVAVRVGWFYPTTSTTPDQLRFRAQDMIDWRLVSGEHEIRVVASAGWKLELALSQRVQNIVFFPDGRIGCGSNYENIEPRPHARAFFDNFSRGKDDPRTIPVLGERAFSANRPRRATEAVLQLGERVAVLGTLRAGADGALCLEADEGGLITNSQRSLLSESHVLVVPPKGDNWAPPKVVEHMNARRASRTRE